MAELFTLNELKTFLQKARAPDATGQGGDPPGTWQPDDVWLLARELATDEVRAVVGVPRFEAVTVPPPGVKRLALQVASRVMLNPEGLRSRTVGPRTEVFASETFRADLTDAERDLLRQAYAVGESSPARVGTMRVRAGLA